MKTLKNLCVYLLLLSLLTITPATVFAAGKVNINTATVTELTQLSGVGEKTAEAIVAYRTEHKFKSVSELVNVKGIGEKTLAKFKDQITVGNTN